MWRSHGHFCFEGITQRCEEMFPWGLSPKEIGAHVFFFFFFSTFWPHHLACEILVPRPGIEPIPPAVKVWSLSHWTYREVPKFILGVVYSMGFENGIMTCITIIIILQRFHCPKNLLCSTCSPPIPLTSGNHSSFYCLITLLFLQYHRVRITWYVAFSD